MAVYVCIGGYSKDTSNLEKLRELTERLGDAADSLTVGLDLNAGSRGNSDN